MTIWRIREDGVCDVEWFVGDLLNRNAFHISELRRAGALGAIVAKVAA